jgi:2-oxoisovalerate dehydrogenase E2 component (dihydrolipoyl transacylase)
VSEVRDFALPDLGEGLEDAEVVTWRVAVGDAVELNQVLVEVNTAKALVEIPSPWAGVVERLHGSEGDIVVVGAPLVSIRVDAGPPHDGGTAGARDPVESQARPRRTPVLVGYGAVEDEPAFVAPATSPGGGRGGGGGGGPPPPPPPPPPAAQRRAYSASWAFPVRPSSGTLRSRRMSVHVTWARPSVS